MRNYPKAMLSMMRAPSTLPSPTCVSVIPFWLKSCASICTHPPYPVLWYPGDGLPGSRPGLVTLPGLAPWRVACGVSGTCGWQRFTWRRAHVPHGVGSPGVCASLMFRHLAGRGPHRRPPATGVVACTPCQVVWLGAPLGLRGRPTCAGCSCLMVAAVWRVGTH